MRKFEKFKINSLVQSQFGAMEELAELIRRLNESKDEQDKSRAVQLAKILDRISKDSLEIGRTISDRAA